MKYKLFVFGTVERFIFHLYQIALLEFFASAVSENKSWFWAHDKYSLIDHYVNETKFDTSKV